MEKLNTRRWFSVVVGMLIVASFVLVAFPKQASAADYVTYGDVVAILSAHTSAGFFHPTCLTSAHIRLGLLILIRRSVLSVIQALSLLIRPGLVLACSRSDPSETSRSDEQCSSHTGLV
jgi:hypothetical protein